MNEILKLLTQKMEHPLKQAIQRRVDILMSSVKFEKERQGEMFVKAFELGWNLERIEIICCLNAFYQVVLGPLASSSRPEVGAGLLTEHPISYGTKMKFTLDESNEISECHDSFSYIMQHHGIDYWCLQASYAQDILYRLANPREFYG